LLSQKGEREGKGGKARSSYVCLAQRSGGGGYGFFSNCLHWRGKKKKKGVLPAIVLGRGKGEEPVSISFDCSQKKEKESSRFIICSQGGKKEGFWRFASFRKGGGERRVAFLSHVFEEILTEDSGSLRPVDKERGEIRSRQNTLAAGIERKKGRSVFQKRGKLRQLS